MMNNVPIVGVMGSGSGSLPVRTVAKASALGKWLAEQGVHLLTGGGKGVMESVSKAFFEVENRTGLVIGIIPSHKKNKGQSKEGYPNQYTDISICTHLPLSGTQGEDVMSRNHINVLSSKVLVALAGGEGTASEVRLALLYKKPIIAFLDSQSDIPNLPENCS